MLEQTDVVEFINVGPRTKELFQLGQDGLVPNLFGALLYMTSGKCGWVPVMVWILEN